MLLGDWEQRDDLQTVTYTNHVTSSATTNVRAKNREVNFKEAAAASMSVALEPTDQTWLIGCSSLGSVTMDRGDTITTSDGSVWTILWLKLYSFGDTSIYWTCIGRKQ
jgi:hypothetical protein